MKTSKTKFVLIFLVGAFVFQFVTNSLYLSEPRLFPAHAESFLTADAQSGWKNIVAMILLPVKVVLIGPLIPFITFLRQEPDTPPPFFLVGFAFYWTVLALSIYYIWDKLSGLKKG